MIASTSFGRQRPPNPRMNGSTIVLALDDAGVEGPELTKLPIVDVVGVRDSPELIRERNLHRQPRVVHVLGELSGTRRRLAIDTHRSQDAGKKSHNLGGIRGFPTHDDERPAASTTIPMALDSSTRR